MKKKAKIYTIGACCIAAGILITGAGIAAGGWPGVSVSSTGVHTAGNHNKKEPYVLEKTKLDEFDNINIHLEYADFDIIPSDDFYLEYRLLGSQNTPEFNTDNKTLTLKEIPNNNGQIMFFNFGSFYWGDNDAYENEKYYVKLYVPEDKVYDEVKIFSSSGDFSAATLEAQDLSLEVEYGDIDADTINGKSLNLSMDSGNFKVEEVKSDTMTLTNDYGYTRIRDLNAGTAEIEVDSGDVNVDKAIIDDLTLSDSYGAVKFSYADIAEARISMSSGDLSILDAVIGSLEADSEYGDVDVHLRDDPSSYTMKLKTEYGSVNVPYDGSYISGDDVERFEMEGKIGKSLKISCDSGDITVK